MSKRKFFKVLLSAVVGLTMLATAACTPSEVAALEGILQEVDSANGQITIVTKDGKTVTLDITTETEVVADGDSSTLGSLAPGASVEIEVKKNGKVASHIKARQAEVEGTIVGIEGDKITIETERGYQRVLVVGDQTRIELDEDFPGTLADLQVGVEVEAKFDPSSYIAFKIEVEEDEDEDEETSALILGDNQGIIEVRVTDPPPADIVSAVVYLSNIEIHRVSGSASSNVSNNASDNVSNNASDNVSDNESDDTGSWVMISSNITSFDLMDVIGVTAFLTSASVDAGKFTQIRMDVDRVEVVTADGENITAEVPGGKLRIVRPFDVTAGVKTILTIDFDGEKSLILAGQDKVIFKPVVKLEIDKDKIDD